MKINLTIELKEMMKTAVDEVSEKDFAKATDALPRNVVKLPKEETQTSPGVNAKVFTHEVKEGESLKSISERYGISYGELSAYILNSEGSTSLHKGQEIAIPRHFIDLSKAV